MFAPCSRWFLAPVSLSVAHFSPAMCSSQYTKIIQKKQKTSAVEPEQPSPSAALLSPEQLEKIARNKRAAMERLASAQTPPGFGESWRMKLSAEFGKPYFKRVRGRHRCDTKQDALRCVVITSHVLCHSWWTLFPRRGEAALCTHLLKMSSPGRRCVTSEMWVQPDTVWQSLPCMCHSHFF